MSVALSGDLHRGPDTHTNRPAATAVGVGTLYECTTHNLIYRSNGSTWVTYAAVIPPGGTSNQVLTKNSGTDYDLSWQTPGGGSGTLTVQDENSNVATSVTQIDLQGAGVTASSGTGEVVVTIPGGVLAAVAYCPSTLANYTTSSTTPVDADGTNLAITFTAPASGEVIVRLSGQAVTNNSAGQGWWCLRSGSSLVGNPVYVVSGTSQSGHVIDFLVTGLTAGGSYTYKWGYFVGNASHTNTIYAGGPASTSGVGAAVMTVTAVA